MKGGDRKEADAVAQAGNKNSMERRRWQWGGETLTVLGCILEVGLTGLEGATS